MTYRSWLDYFVRNQNHFDHIDWASADTLTKEEKEIIAASLQQFQKGENSEGKNLIRYARESGLTDYPEVIILFIREEQRHAAVLGRFMKMNAIDRIKEHWMDTIFRKLRTLAGLENSILVLITAEIIAAVYYDALFHATGSRTLRNLCEQILCDEDLHINFQSFTLKQFYNKRNRFSQWTIRWLHRILMTGTTALVWAWHRDVLRLGGYSASRFFRSVSDEFERSDRMITGRESILIEPAEKSILAWTSR